MANSKQPQTRHRTISWDDSWKISTPEEIADLYREIQSLVENTDPSRGVQAIQLTSVGTKTLTFLGDYLVVTKVARSGEPMQTYMATATQIDNIRYGRGSRMLKKTWLRYFSFNEGHVWKCTYNEHPASPKHMLSDCIPATGDQLQQELSSLLERPRKPNVPAASELVKGALQHAIYASNWVDVISDEAMHRIVNNFAVILQVFKLSPLPYQLVHDALNVLQGAVDMTDDKLTLVDKYRLYITPSLDSEGLEQGDNDADR